jgi:dTDP-4-amino-4,6-dideoxygalactose transaminase
MPPGNDMDFRLPLTVNMLGAEEISAAKAVLDSGFLTMGRLCEQFEREFATYIGAEHAVMVNSGSSANLLALFALTNRLLTPGGRRRLLRPGDEVIVPALSWSTSIWPVLQIGATPVFVDCDPNTLQMIPEAIGKAITPKTAAIVVVHVLGGACDLTAIGALAEQNGLWLIEDTCESLGVLWDGRRVGTYGDMGTFSFYFSHHITTIEGGMVVTQDGKLADLLRSMRSHGWARAMSNADEIARQYPDIDPRFLFVTTGFNLRPTEINAAIGLAQLKRLEAFNARRREIAQRFDRGFAGLRQNGDLRLVQTDPRCVPAPFGYTVLCRTPEARRRLGLHLEKRGVETRPIICGNIVRQPAFRHLDYRVSGRLDGADLVMDCGIYWGPHPGLTDAAVDRVIEIVKTFFERADR